MVAYSSLWILFAILIQINLSEVLVQVRRNGGTNPTVTVSGLRSPLQTVQLHKGSYLSILPTPESTTHAVYRISDVTIQNKIELSHSGGVAGELTAGDFRYFIEKRRVKTMTKSNPTAAELNDPNDANYKLMDKAPTGPPDASHVNADIKAGFPKKNEMIHCM